MALNKSYSYTMLGSFFGFLSFIFAVIAETKKAPEGTSLLENGVVTCTYPKDQTVLLGALSMVALSVGVGLSQASMLSSYKGNSMKFNLLLKCTKLKVFFVVAWLVSLLALVLTLWPTVSQSILLNHNIYHDKDAVCSTAKTGLIGGAGFMSLNAVLMWFIVFMLSQNRKIDIYDEEFENHYDASIGSFRNAYIGH